MAVTVLVPVEKSRNDFDDVGARIALATVEKQMKEVLFLQGNKNVTVPPRVDCFQE